METEFTLFIVDDAEASRLMIESSLGQLYNVESFASGAACVERMATRVPDIFLLDVDMPAMNGYELCRHIRSQSATCAAPVIFISGLDDLDSRLAGYDAGGDDFIVKPYRVAELKQKIEVLRRIDAEKHSLQQRLDESDMLASLILSNLDEYAVLIKFLRSLNGCNGYHAIAGAALAMLKAFNLEGALQFRLPGFELTMNRAGEVRPLEASIINQVRSLGTVAEFKNRAVFNFERISILVSNMPLADPELCGRLRDHLAIAAETVDSKLLALQTHQENSHTKDGIASLLQALGATVSSFSDRYEKSRYQGSETKRQMLEELDAAFASLGMREVQEDGIKEIVRTKTDELIDIFDFSTETETTLVDLSARLASTLKTKSA